MVELHVHDLEKDCIISIANALEILRSHTQPQNLDVLMQKRRNSSAIKPYKRIPFIQAHWKNTW